MTPPAPTPEQVIAAWWDHPEPVMHPDDVRSAKRVLALFAQALAAAQARVAALEAAKWAAEVNADESMQSASEAWARCAELVEMLEGRKPVDAEMITKLKEHRAHVVATLTRAEA